MNDTLDYFAVSQIDNFVNENILTAQGSRTQNITEYEDSISLNDSQFLETFDSEVIACLKEVVIPVQQKILSQEDNSLTQTSRKKIEEESSNGTLQASDKNDLDSIITDTNQKHEFEKDMINNHIRKRDSALEPQKCSLKSPVKNDNLRVPSTPDCNTSSSYNSYNKQSVDEITTQNVYKDLHHLSSWGLPELVLKGYEKRNISMMFDWQLECLSKNNIISENKNLVYSAPTSAGKTLVAEILAIKCLFERKKKVIFILPFISVVREKMYYFQDILSSSGKRVEGFMGSHNPPGGFQPVHLAVGTIEKCNGLVNRLLVEGTLEDIGLVIIDEVHLIGDPHRGYILEFLLTKLKYIMSKNKKIQIQIVGMSATLPNLDVLAEWLNAELYTTNFRPIPLHEMVYANKQLYNNEFKPLRKLRSIPELASDTDDILQLSLETIEKSCSVLIFCPTKNWCENLAQQIAMAFWKIGRSDSALSKILHANLSVEKITEVLEQLKYCPSGLDRILKNTVAFGVAFHHAGLTMEERDIIEGGFRSGGIKLLIATSTLSSGVNLPARRVIIRSPLFGGRPINILTYRQMIGRAGRMGIDSEGQSILICQKADFNTAKLLTQSSLKPIESCLLDVGKFKRAILEIIASGVASSPEDLNIFEKCTLISLQNANSDDKIDPVAQVVEFLKNFQFIRLQTMEDGTCKYFPSALGKACLSSSLPPGEGLELFTELEKARQCFVLETELHIIYLVTPFNACYQWSNIDWMFYLELWEKLPLNMKKVGELVGVREAFIINATRGKIPDSPKLLIHKRFFVSLALQDLVNEKPLDEVAAKFSCNRGLLQSLQQSASSFAGMVTAFSKQLGWSSVEILISQFQDRLQFGINRDLLDLMRLPCLNSKQARAIYNAGIENLIQLANSDVYTIENILHKVVPFENINEREGETDYEFKQRNKLRTIWITGKQGLTEKEAAEFILRDAREYLEHEMGVQNIKWGSKDQEEENQEEVFKQNDSSLTNNNNVDQSDALSNLNIRNLAPLNESNSQRITSSIEMTEPQQKISKISVKSKENVVENLNAKNERQQDIITSLQHFENLNLLSPQRSTKGIDLETPKCCNLSDQSMSSKKSLYNVNSNHVSNTTQDSTKRDQNSLESVSDDDLFDDSLEDAFDKVSALSVDNRKRNNAVNICPHSKKQKVVHLNNLIMDDDEVCSSQLTTVKERNTIPIDLSKFYIVDVGNYEELYQSFCEELLNQSDVALSLACKEMEENQAVIGINLNKSERKNYRYHFQGKIIDGIAFTWDGKNVYYLHLENDGCSEKIEILRNFLGSKQKCIKIFDNKECIVMLYRALELDVSTRIEDPKVADWILEPDGREKNFHAMINKYCPEAKGLSLLVENCISNESIGMNVENDVEPRMRAAVETIVTWTLMAEMKEILIEHSEHSIDTYQIEMSAALSVSRMEIAGIGIELNTMESLMSSIKSNASAIERRIYNLAGRKFSLTCTKEIVRVIGLGTSRKLSAKKEILEQSKHPIAKLLLLWRKLDCTLSKTLQPLFSAVKNNRVFGKWITHTSTGRLSMHEPNVQNIAKDFEFVNPITNENVKISCRSIFVPKNGYVFLSADYCQLELRMMAHLSQDELLCRILRSEGDIFKSIAAKWNNISEDLVSDVLRAQTKQICYGIIYGIGSKALADQLKIQMDEAALFMENFKNTYPGLKNFIQNVINSCRTNGYITTLSGRRRNLPLIEDQNTAIRSHAERQAVNSTIQGSAADLVKIAMKKIEENFNYFLETNEKPFLVLHLHDELIFEVHERLLAKTAQLVKKSMESSVNLSVPFPVKLKTGLSWGGLVENCDIY